MALDKLTIILLFYNEEGWIGKTIDSLAGQSISDFSLILIDNNSNDASTEEAARHMASLGSRARIISCLQAGKIHALAAGLAEVETSLVATCDADTYYPPDYVKRIFELFAANENAAAVMAMDLYAPAQSVESQRRIEKIIRKSRVFSAKCHAGGYAQAFRTEILRRVGGFDVRRWPYVLEDHEIIARVMQYGSSIYCPKHYCFPAPRREHGKSTSWTRAERLMYRYLPVSRIDWFFYSFLGPRLASRNALSLALQSKSWLD